MQWWEAIEAWLLEEGLHESPGHTGWFVNTHHEDTHFLSYKSVDNMAWIPYAIHPGWLSPDWYIGYIDREPRLIADPRFFEKLKPKMAEFAVLADWAAAVTMGRGTDLQGRFLLAERAFVNRTKERFEKFEMPRRVDTNL